MFVSTTPVKVVISVTGMRTRDPRNMPQPTTTGALYFRMRPTGKSCKARRQRRKGGPRRAPGRKRQRRQVSGCRDEDRTDDGENGTEDFLPRGSRFSRMQYHMMMRTGMMYSRTVAAAALLTLMQAK